jgi:hypothetical protein
MLTIGKVRDFRRAIEAIATKRSHYKPLCEALRRQGHAVPEVAVIVICVRGSIPTSTLETLKLLRRPEPGTGEDSPSENAHLCM